MRDKLWILGPHPARPDADEWPDWGESQAFVVLAYSEDDARQFAVLYTAANGKDSEGAHWLDSKQSTCTQVDLQGPAGVILESNVGL